MEFSRQEYWSRLPFPSPGDIQDSGIEPGSPALGVDSLLSEPPGKPLEVIVSYCVGNCVVTLIAVLYQMQFHCLRKLAHTLVPDMQQFIWQMLLSCYLSVKPPEAICFQMTSLAIQLHRRTSGIYQISSPLS